MASLLTYGLADLKLLLEHYYNHQSSTFKGKVVDQEPIVDRDMANAEWPNFKQLVFLKRQEHRDRCDIELNKARSNEEQELLMTKKEKFGPHKLFASLRGDSICEDIFPECSKLLLLLLLFPLSTA